MNSTRSALPAFINACRIQRDAAQLRELVEEQTP
jgi:hypothetical protein